LRFVQPEKGRILIDGIHLNDFLQRDLYSLIAWLPQNPVIFKGSILDNLKIANPFFAIEEINNILEKVKLLDFINDLPENIHTEIQEHGSTISSGQRQKIGLARILMREHSLILCDEPTSSLDPITERLVVETLDNIRKENILISIAHKLKTIEKADSILFFQKGYPIYSGSYENLKKENLNFRNFINIYYGETN